MLGVAISTAALIIVLSVFNGLESLLRNLNNSFDPEIKIEATQGKSFPVTNELTKKIVAVPGVKLITEIIEDYAYARYRDANQVVTIKGVSENFVQQARIPKDNIVDGKLQIKDGKVSYAIVGRGISNALSIDVHDQMIPLQLYYIKNVQATSLDPSQLYSQRNILPGGIFSIVQNLDDNYVIVPLSFAQELLNYGNKRTSLEIKVKEGFEIRSIQKNLKTVLGKDFFVLNQDEQHKDLYRLLKMEKLVTFLSLSLLLSIGSINIFFSLMMLAIDKKKDISVLFAMGAPKELIRNIFLAEGALISLIGAIIGICMGGFFIWLQTQFGLVSMGMESSVTESYPVKVAFWDFLYTLGVVTLITFSISIRPAILASNRYSLQSL
jgi:lipoprotein-releasing system permease protein